MSEPSSEPTVPFEKFLLFHFFCKRVLHFQPFNVQPVLWARVVVEVLQNRRSRKARYSMSLRVRKHTAYCLILVCVLERSASPNPILSTIIIKHVNFVLLLLRGRERPLVLLNAIFRVDDIALVDHLGS